MENNQFQNNQTPNNQTVNNQASNNQPPMQYQKSSEPINKNLLIICGTIIIICILIIIAFLYSNANFSDSKNSNVLNQPQTLNQPQLPVKVSTDDDAVLGNPNAPVTMIEFSDYECPFCKRHFELVYPEILKNYVATGKLKIVFRDFVAVQSHNPLAMLEAMAAECAREQGGDSVYFKYHDALFLQTTSNGKGLAESKLPEIAKSLGLNQSVFKTCLDSQKFKDEFDKDNQDANLAGVTGTPSFFVGKSTVSGVIDGTIIVGAESYSVFADMIDIALTQN